MLTTWPAFTEAMHLLGARAGWPAQDALWTYLERAQLEVVELSAELRERTRALMEKYSDTPMALADATLVAVAEERGLLKVFTLDEDFRVYRIKGNKRFEIVP